MNKEFKQEKHNDAPPPEKKNTECLLNQFIYSDGYKI